MIEKNSAGVKELIYSVLWAWGILLAYDFIDTALRIGLGEAYGGRDLILTCAAVLAGCALAYFVLTRYAAAFVYETDKKGVKITRKIGHREKTLEIKNKELRSIAKEKPAAEPKVTHKMKKSIFSDKKTYYLTFVRGRELMSVAFEPSEKMAEEIAKRIKEG